MIKAEHYSIDGNQVCRVGVNFTNLQECPAGFGDSLKDAFLDYLKSAPRTKAMDLKEWELPWFYEYAEQLRGN